MDLVLDTQLGQKIGAHVEKPEGQARGCVLVLHEAFGVTSHIRSVCRQYAAEGFIAIAPHLYAWATGKPEGKVLGQDKAGLDEGRSLIEATQPEQLVETARVFMDWAAGQGLRTAVVGYCWGGSVAYLVASQLSEMAACSSYYGGRLWEVVAMGQPKCPRMIHLATLDRYIPLEKTIAAFGEFDPGCEVFVYDADHGFNRDDGKTYDVLSAQMAKARTLELFNKTMT